MKKAGALLALALLTNPALADHLNEKAVVGGALGGAVGGYVGAEMHGRDGAIIGSAIGAAVGAAISTEQRAHERVVVHERPVAVVHEHHHHHHYHKKGKHKHKGGYKCEYDDHKHECKYDD